MSFQPIAILTLGNTKILYSDNFLWPLAGLDKWAQYTKFSLNYGNFLPKDIRLRAKNFSQCKHQKNFFCV